MWEACADRAHVSFHLRSPPFHLACPQKEEKKKWEPPVPTRVGRKKKKGSDARVKLPAVHPTTRCRLKLLKQERIKDYLLLEEGQLTPSLSSSF